MFLERFNKPGGALMRPGGTPEELSARMRADLASYEQLIKATGIRID